MCFDTDEGQKILCMDILAEHQIDFIASTCLSLMTALLFKVVVMDV
jgi:regulator of RNase E activity RraB